MSEHETIADIVAMLRANARGDRSDGFSFTSLADRLDAAHKREQSQSWHHREMEELVLRHEKELVDAKKSSGDCAKLREALKPVKRYLDGYTVNILELRRTVDAALTAPARNCDRFASSEEAWDAYDEWVELYRAKGETEPFNEFGWLFAPATEKEGGNNADK